ncbi:RNA polymerase sigma-54 factor [Alcaligenes faecalis]|uniref:RNA polymerase factor sigma-54 n=1 Tax=Alcaligenes faecalis TaxID=511 RepID=UPI00129405D4|nr:RNA polymerase factor sigma-54 [Alcaligenes faecalis]QFY76331.1 RNA polymerase sigma-54 factor [Alcaligenes faecalis]
MLTRQSLDLRQQQTLVLTPQLQQSIKVLQLSGAELEQELAQALLDNPLLERLDVQTDVAAEPLPEATSGEAESSWASLEFPKHQGDSDDPDWTPESAIAQDLAAYLSEQLGLLRLSDRDRALAQLLIDELDDNGYLPVSLEEVLACLPEELDIDESDLRCALAQVQSLDPAGVGARDLAECLGLQLMQQAQQLEPALLDCARYLVREHVGILASPSQLRQRCAGHYPAELVERAHHLVLKLDPKPGRAWTQNVSAYVVPDVLLIRGKDSWQAALNPLAVPRLQLVNLHDYEIEAHPALLAERQKATGLLRSVNSRFVTILRVAQAIVQMQQDFFTQGVSALKPMQLADLAAELDLHESTISRATRQKYMQTPHGVMELKQFFTVALASADGKADLSAASVRAQIAQMIRDESPTKPLSDQQITDLLQAQGLTLARRTVAKYREAEGLAPASQRKMRAAAGV